jgi:cellulose biosynthesis protein BcsQ
MILVCGGIKGGVGKTTLATSMAVLRAAIGRDVLLVDADDQATATDFTAVRNETLAASGGAGYTSIKLHGAAVRNEVMKLAPKYDDVANAPPYSPLMSMSCHSSQAVLMCGLWIVSGSWCRKPRALTRNSRPFV